MAPAQCACPARAAASCACALEAPGAHRRGRWLMGRRPRASSRCGESDVIKPSVRGRPQGRTSGPSSPSSMAWPRARLGRPRKPCSRPRGECKALRPPLLIKLSADETFFPSGFPAFFGHYRKQCFCLAVLMVWCSQICKMEDLERKLHALRFKTAASRYFS